jgi:hypothetical protein
MLASHEGLCPTEIDRYLDTSENGAGSWKHVGEIMI